MRLQIPSLRGAREAGARPTQAPPPLPRPGGARERALRPLLGPQRAPWGHLGSPRERAVRGRGGRRRRETPDELRARCPGAPGTPGWGVSRCESACEWRPERIGAVLAGIWAGREKA
eukprot:scaffold704_cov347-Prasinococcus_capsulatus_cf.AAC.9